MVISYVPIPLKPEVHERLLALRARVSEMHRYEADSLGLSPMVAIMIEHFENAPPDPTWLKEQMDAAPKRGRPRRSQPVTRIDEWGKPVLVGPTSRKPNVFQHTWVSPRNPPVPGFAVCRHCSDLKNDEFPGRGLRCAKNDPWTKAELRTLHFTDDEIGWAHD